jgi:hypothetical protein
MQTAKIVARLLDSCLPFMHKARWQALCDVSLAALHGHALSLTALALGTTRHTTLRHRVKCVDRLLANPHLHQERFAVYRALAHQWLCDMPQLLIVVDWSSLTADLCSHWLRASVVVEGRSITLYEEVHPRDKLAAHTVHRDFLEQLSKLLPPTARPPILLTDAGFRTPWFRLVEGHGWYWIGRTRNRDFVRQGQGEWFPAKNLYVKATATPTDLGEYQAVRNRPFTCRFALVKPAPTGRKDCYPSGKEKRNSSKQKIATRYREPWLLIYSPSLAYLGAAAMVKCYGQRMKIEQQFRDTKNLALGMGLSATRSEGQRRLQALLLLAHIAQLAKRLIGEAAKAQQLELQFLSNNITKRKTISVMTLAARLIRQFELVKQIKDPWRELQSLRQQASGVLGNLIPAA